MNAVQSVGIIVNVSMEGQQKVITFESQVLIANNHTTKTLKLIVSSEGSAYETEGMVATILPGDIFRVPLNWIFGKNYHSLNIETSRGHYPVLKNL